MEDIRPHWLQGCLTEWPERDRRDSRFALASAPNSFQSTALRFQLVKYRPMKRFEFWAGLSALTLTVLLGSIVPEIRAEDTPTEDGEAIETVEGDEAENAEEELEETEDSEVSEEDDFELAIEDTEKLRGLIDLYHNEEDGTVLAEIDADRLDRTYLLIATLSRGIGELGIVNGLPMADFAFQLEKRGETIHLTLPNVKFRFDESGDRGTNPAVLDRSFSDSTIYSFSIVATHSDRDSYLIDLTDLLVNRDISGFNGWLGFLGYSPNSSTSFINDVRAYPENLEFEATIGFSGEPFWFWPETLPDARNLSLGFRYSLSELPDNSGFRPRLADNRVGYFVSAYQNLDRTRDPDRFVRLIQRWHLEKRDPEAELSPPEEPIVFWIENTVPHEHRQAVRDGILSWNAAFEQAGFIDAIEVRQMPNNADWDPEDVRYNVVRWLTTDSVGFAGLGPSRVNPLTGEILDADILIDGNIARLASRQVSAYLGNDNSMAIEQLARQLVGSHSRPTNAAPIDLTPLQARCQGESCQRLAEIPPFVPLSVSGRTGLGAHRNLGHGQAAVGAMAMPLLQGVLPYRENLEKYVNEYIAHIVSHEVGHTIGLRHNFHGSTNLTLAELNNPTTAADRGITSSIMDYTPVNLAPVGGEQGQFYQTEVGNYDHWAVEFGYSDFGDVSPAEERDALMAIANRAQYDPSLAYGHDEDAWIGRDPTIAAFDLTSEPTAYARQQFDNARAMWERLDSTYANSSGAADEMRTRFSLILSYYFRQSFVLLEHIGGQSFTRTSPENGDRRVPLEPIARETQLESLDLLAEYIFAPDAFNFDNGLLAQLVPSRWSHWGSNWFADVEYPAFDRVSSIQKYVLGGLMSASRLEQLREIEFKSEPGEALTLPELFDRLDRSIWSEVQTATPTNVNDLRRELQRSYVNRQVDMMLERRYAPEDARTLARRSLRRIHDRLDAALGRSSQLDAYTQAHLEDTKIQIERALNAVRITDQAQSNPFFLFGF